MSDSEQATTAPETTEPLAYSQDDMHSAVADPPGLLDIPASIVGDSTSLVNSSSTEENITTTLESAGKPQDVKQAGGSDEKSFKFFVGGIKPDAWEVDLQAYFSVFGSVEEVQVMKDHATGRNRGFGFVTMAQNTDKELIFKREHTIKGKRVEVREMQTDGSSNLKRKIFVGGINPIINEEQLTAYFVQFGTVEKLNIMRDAQGKSRGFGFIVFSDEATTAKILTKNMHFIDSENRVEVRAAEMRHKTMGRGAHGMGRGVPMPMAFSPYAYYGRPFSPYAPYTPPPPSPQYGYSPTSATSATSSYGPPPPYPPQYPMPNPPTTTPYQANYWSTQGTSAAYQSSPNAVATAAPTSQAAAMAAYTAAYGQQHSYTQHVDSYGPQRTAGVAVTQGRGRAPYRATPY